MSDTVPTLAARCAPATGCWGARACRRQGNADLLLLVDAVRGDVPLIELALPMHELPFAAHRLRGDRRGRCAALVTETAASADEAAVRSIEEKTPPRDVINAEAPAPYIMLFISTIFRTRLYLAAMIVRNAHDAVRCPPRHRCELTGLQ
jgi:hypothetical protein